MKQPECTVSDDIHDGVVCDTTVQIRRLAFNGATPGFLMAGMGMKIIRYDDSLLAA